MPDSPDPSTAVQHSATATATPTAAPMLVTVRRVSDLGHAIAKRRKAMGLNLIEAAGLCAVGTRFLFDLEHGKESIEFGRTIKVANRFGIRLMFEQPALEVADDR